MSRKQRETLSGLPRTARRGRSQNRGKPAGGDHHPGRVKWQRDFEGRSRVFGGNLDERSEREGSTGNCRHFGLLTSAHWLCPLTVTKWLLEIQAPPLDTTFWTKKSRVSIHKLSLIERESFPEAPRSIDQDKVICPYPSCRRGQENNHVAFTAPVWEVDFDKEKRTVREEWLLARLQVGLPGALSGRDAKQIVTHAGLRLRKTIQARDFTK